MKFPDHKKAKKGFTIIEVTLVLALTGLLLIGLLGGSYSAISSQRYNDSVRSFAEYLRTVYSEVINPESLGLGTSSKYAIYGKVLSIGYKYDGDITSDDNRSIYSATLIGNADIPSTLSGSIINELAEAEAKLYCGQSITDDVAGMTMTSTLHSYTPAWLAEINNINQPAYNTSIRSSDRFTGTIIIARAPSSSVVHTFFTEKTYNLRDQCQGATNSEASTTFQTDLQAFGEDPSLATTKFIFTEIGFCVKSDNATQMREVKLAKDGRNTSAVSIIDADSEENRCR